MKRVLISPNPYRDKSFQYAAAAERILNGVGVQTKNLPTIWN